MWWQALGVTLAAVLNGLFYWASSVITQVGLGINPWWGVLLAIVVAVTSVVAVRFLMRRANQITLSGTDASQTSAAGS